jgi:hypothetical protein
MAHDYKFKAIVWLSLIMIALAVASIDVMMYKVNLLNPQNEPAVTQIVFNDVWYKISVLILMVPALFTYYITKSIPRSLLVVLAGLMLIFFGLEDVLYFAIRGVVIPDQIYAQGINPGALTQIGFINHMPNDLYWLNNSLCITIFGYPVTQFVLFKSTAFALAMSLILVMI